MAAIHRFRSAFNGFKREDVVHYIEYLNNQHSSQIEQLNTQLQNAIPQQEVAALQAQLDAALEKCAQLEARLAERPSVVAEKPAPADFELETYRRAERTERLARERAQQIYAKADSVLLETIHEAEAATENINAIAKQIASTKQTFQEAVESLQAIRPKDI